MVSSVNRQVWPVGALCHAVADALDARFNPVTVEGELSGFSRAASGHCYFSLKDAQGQLRCAMFRRAASLMDFSPRDGEKVQVRGRLGVYEPRGDLQLVVESMTRAGMGSLFEQFLVLKAKLEAEGLFDTARKREVPALPRAIGVVTSLGAAALHDVMTALQRRVPHIPVVLVSASVQGASAPQEMVQALQNLYQKTFAESAVSPIPVVDVILLVRGGGSLEDLWAFNDEALVRCVTQSPVPLISGVGHETDFTLVDFAADLRAPTPTAAAELAALARESLLQAVANVQADLQTAVERQLDRHAQGLDLLTRRLGRPSGVVAQQSLALSRLSQRLPHAVATRLQQDRTACEQWETRLQHARDRALAQARHRLEAASLSLKALDPSLVLQRGYAWVADQTGQPVTHVAQIRLGQKVNARLADGELNLSVLGIQANPDKNS